MVNARIYLKHAAFSLSLASHTYLASVMVCTLCFRISHFNGILGVGIFVHFLVCVCMWMFRIFLIFYKSFLQIIGNGIDLEKFNYFLL